LDERESSNLNYSDASGEVSIAVAEHHHRKENRYYAEWRMDWLSIWWCMLMFTSLS